jgi:hypothetical protein
VESKTLNFTETSTRESDSCQNPEENDAAPLSINEAVERSMSSKPLQYAAALFRNNPDTGSARVVGSYRQRRNDPDAKPKIPARREHTACRLDVETGEVICSHYKDGRYLGAPRDDCRQAWCPYAAEMRTRLLIRLREAYAPGENRNVDRLFSQLGLED